MMAKKFAGFTPEQLGKMFPEVAGMQGDEAAAVLAASPKHSAKLALFQKRAQAMLDDAMFAQVGGYINPAVEESYLSGRGSDSQNQALPTVAPPPVQPPAPIMGSPEQGQDLSQRREDRSIRSRDRRIKVEADIAKIERDLANPDIGPARRAQLEGQLDNKKNVVLPKRIAAEERFSEQAEVSASQPVEDSSDNVGINQPTRIPPSTPAPSPAPPSPAPPSPAPPSPITGSLEERQNVAQRREDRSIRSTERRIKVEADIAKIERDLANPDIGPARREQLEGQLDNKKNVVLPNRIEAEERFLEQAEVAEDALSAIETPRPAEVQSEVAELQERAIEDPASFRPDRDTQLTTDEQRDSGVLDEGVGQVGPAPTVTAERAVAAPDVATPVATEAASYDVTLATPEVQDVLDQLEAATGRPSDEALAQAATMPPEELAQLGLSAAQINEAVQVVKPDDRVLEEGELIAGSAVDMDRVREEVNFSAATGTPSSEATVQGQLTGLLGQFEESKEPPPWAAGAMRAATAALAQRGLSASSMAGQAVVQAAMESALPIAQADAKTFERFEIENLSNRQQAALFAAEQRASFLNMEFTQEFQTRVANSAKITDIANMNFSAETGIALENASLTQTVAIENLSASNAKVLADSAAMTAIDTTNLNNRQQAQVQQANAFLDMDMSNLSNEQQSSVIKAQGLVNALLSDAAAENASNQFNASSQQQNDQFFSSLASEVAQFNNSQRNAMEQFNVNEANGVSQFNAGLVDQRDRFNASNALIIEQANTQWFQSIATTDNAAINQANRDTFLTDANMTTNGFNAFMQTSRDIMNFAFNSGQNDLDRATAIGIEVMRIEAAVEAARGNKSAAKTDGLFGALGSIAGKVIGSDVFLNEVFG